VFGESKQPEAQPAPQAMRPKPVPPARDQTRRNRVVTPTHEPGDLSAPTRFLHYRPAGTPVGDPGELGQIHDGQPSAAQSVQGLLFRWADTLLSHNLSAHMDLYAPVLARFGNRMNLSRDAVRISKQHFLATLSHVRHFEIHDVRIQQQAHTSLTSVEFRVEWQTAGAAPRVALYRLTLDRGNGRWQIQSEERLDT
jgi:hypothetical protein